MSDDLKPTCQRCKCAESVLFCVVHKVYLCAHCEREHCNGECFYQPAAPIRLLQHAGQFSLQFPEASESSRT